MKKRGLKKYIHVNRQHIAQNVKDGGNRPTLTVKTSKSNTYGHRVEIQGPSTLIDGSYCLNKQLSCGARVWIETHSPVIIDEKINIT